ncbi:MAG: Rid family detoxifying hydrolase [Tissierellia bacterium]|nr:Rid family detoxifying hydrolase [Tissierellia bacterium]
MKFLHSDKAPAAIGPYSQGTKAGNQIYVSGQLPIVDGELQTDPAKATKASLDNVLAVVEAGGGKLEDIAKVSVFVKDLNDFGTINEVYAEFFGDHKPARACVEVAKLPKDAVVEIEAVAFVE